MGCRKGPVKVASRGLCTCLVFLRYPVRSCWGSTKSSACSIASSRAPTAILPTTSSGCAQNGAPECLRITLAVAGFTRDQLDVTIEESQLVIRGRQQDDKSRQYIHRGIAARHFQRTFVLAEGMEVRART